MFTWICPKCGREVPPSYSECPNCAATTEPVKTEPEVPSPAPPPVREAQPVKLPEAAPAPVEAVHRVEKSRAMSPTVAALLAMAGVCGLLALLYFVVLPKGASTAAVQSPSATFESPGTAGVAQSAHPLAKHVEISGVRLIGEKGRTRVQILVINHSGADLPELKLRVQLAAEGRTPFEFPVTVPSLGPYEYRDLAATVKTNLKPYEWPDWQFIRPKFQVVSE